MSEEEVSLAEASCLQLSVLAGHLGIDTKPIIEKHIEAEAKELEELIIAKLSKIDVIPKEALRYCKLRGIKLPERG